MLKQRKQPNRVDELLDELLADNYSPEAILGESGLIKKLSKRLIERALDGELKYHLKLSASMPQEAENTPLELVKHNSRNGYSSKTVQSEQGALKLAIARDRNGEFEPILVPKHQRRLAGLDEKILALYARGMGVRDISAQRVCKVVCVKEEKVIKGTCHQTQ